MGGLCRGAVSLFLAAVLTVSVVVGLSGCKKKSGPEKIAEGVGETVEEAGESIQEGVDDAAGK